MGNLDQETAPDLTRELGYLRRDVERLSLRLRQETERTQELEEALETERGETAVERERLESEQREVEGRVRELEDELGERDAERAHVGRLEREVHALRTELRWARIVSSAALAVVFLLAIWLVVLVV